MYAVIEQGSKQYKVAEGDLLNIDLTDISPDAETIELDKVLLVSDGQNPIIGTPYVENASVEAEVTDQAKDDKVTVFKFKRRTKYRRTRGHRQDFSELRITKINVPS